MSDSYKVIGVMSGTSLDGLDLAYCHFDCQESRWCFDLKYTRTIDYPKNLLKTLETVDKKSALELSIADVRFGEFIGEEIKRWVDEKKIQADFISSHGHTIFHQPLIGLTKQIGNGATIAGITGLPVVNDFRVADVALGGQGAPLVPIGDRMLFGEYRHCLNLGGIANISMETKKGRIAFDIAPCNMVLNWLANQLDKSYDEDGNMARDGKLNRDLLEELNELSYYQELPPKSLGREWVERKVFPILKDYDGRIRDKLHTFCHHIALQLRNAIEQTAHLSEVSNYVYSQTLVTGGGAFNRFLIDQINSYNAALSVQIPSQNTIEFKEALIFAFLGVLRWRGEVNTLKTVTGAKRDSCGGIVHMP